MRAQLKPRVILTPGELWSTNSNAKPHVDKELTFCTPVSVSHEL